MKLPDYNWYEVTLTVEVTRRVLAKDENHAKSKVDTSDMIREIENYGFNEELTVRKIDGIKPDEYDFLDDLADQFVKGIYSNTFDMQFALFEKMRQLNQKLIDKGKPPYKPIVLNDLTDDYMNTFIKRMSSEN